MNLPQIGELNRRVKIFFTVHLPDDRLGFSKATAHEDEVWGKIEPVGATIYWGAKQVDSGVTHRITVRRIDGRTRPQDFAGVVELEVDGIRYRVQRVADLGGVNRFTVLDVEEKANVGSNTRRSWISND
jgi:hypothetical protein